jgi:regulator of sigma E protease
MLVGTVSSENLGGLITIAQIAKSSAEQGLSSFLNFLAMISVTLAVLNLLPIPVLDGGHLAWFLIEKLTGKPVKESIQLQAQQIGLVLLLSLMMLAFYNDLTRLFG